MALSGCHHHEHDDSLGHNHSHGHEAPGESEGHDHAPGVIVVEHELAHRFGIVTDTAAPAPFSPALRTSGQVLRSSADEATASAPAAGIVRLAKGMEAGTKVSAGTVIATIDSHSTSPGNATAAAKADLEAAVSELARIEDLHKVQLATEAELTAARAAYARAKAAYSPAAASGRVVAPKDGTLALLAVKDGQYVEAGQEIAAIATGAGSLLRVDVPMRKAGNAGQYTDLIADFGNGHTIKVSEAGGRRSGAPVASEVGSGYIPLYFTTPSGIAPAGSTFTAYLLGAPLEAITVPRSAISEQQGAYYIYLAADHEHYIKQPVTLGASDGRRTEIKSGLSAGDVYVAEGMNAVRLSETSAVAPEGHSHNH